ncbi:MAG: ammonium transporter [Bacteroidota bacterium]
MLSYGDTAWLLTATAMVMLMTPAGLALFYGGLSNKKNVINTVGMSYISFCIGILVWCIAGYSIAFTGSNGIIGSFDKVLLNGITPESLIGTIPEFLYVAFQGVFAAIAVAIISGSVIGRIKFKFWIVFSALWVLLVYSPLVHWIWGDGFMHNLGELDFAGGTVIHINAGVAGLVLALLLGKRKTTGEPSNKPSSVKLTVLGSALLWFGWFGFNSGSQLAADGIAANAFLVTLIAGAAGGVAWLFVETKLKNHPSLIGLSSGVIAGLVGITPASGYVDFTGALVIGLISGLIGYYGVVHMKKTFNYDDTLDAFGIHGLVGIWGSIATGLFANPMINEASGLFYGNPSQLIPQVIAVVVTILFSAIMTFILYHVTSVLTRGARIDQKSEQLGLDKSYHQETSFA